LYDIWPGNGAGQFLQPWSPHRAVPVLSTTDYNQLQDEEISHKSNLINPHRKQNHILAPDNIVQDKESASYSCYKEIERTETEHHCIYALHI